MSLFSSVTVMHREQPAPDGFSEAGARRRALLVPEGQLWPWQKETLHTETAIAHRRRRASPTINRAHGWFYWHNGGNERSSAVLRRWGAGLGSCPMAAALTPQTVDWQH